MASRVETCRRQFGERIRLYRQMRGWDLDDLATRLNKSLATLSRIETGKQNLTMVDIVAIAEALEVSPRDLFQDEAYQGPNHSIGVKVIGTHCEKLVGVLETALSEVHGIREAVKVGL
jgi:transcriptional regulator with XRE-family HTH domain